MKYTLTNYLYFFTILFFAIGFFNIIFAWIGFACLIIPFVILAKTKRKIWCQYYCPRISLFNKIFKNKPHKGKSSPSWVTDGTGKDFVLYYFIFNLFILTMSTIMVFLGRIEPVDKVRFMIAFQLPWDMPQLLNITSVPDWAVHLSFRIYSMMFTSTVVGLILAWLYKPKTWCTICPINTISDMTLNNAKTK